MIRHRLLRNVASFKTNWHHNETIMSLIESNIFCKIKITETSSRMYVSIMTKTKFYKKVFHSNIFIALSLHIFDCAFFLNMFL